MGEKKQQDRIRFNKTNILETAKKLFLEKGVEQTTVADIAKIADYSKSTIYVYFKSKEDIYHHILLEYMIQMKQALEECVNNSNDMIQSYYAICSTLMKLHEENPLFLGSILGKIEVRPEDIEREPVLGEILRVGEEVNHVVEAFIMKGIKEKVIREDIQVIPTVFMMWASICENIIMADKKRDYIKMRMNMSKEEYLEYAFRTLLQSIMMEKD